MNHRPARAAHACMHWAGFGHAGRPGCTRRAPHLDVQDLDVGVQRRGELEGRAAGVHDAQAGAQLLPVQRHRVHRLEGVRPAAQAPSHPVDCRVIAVYSVVLSLGALSLRAPA